MLSIDKARLSIDKASGILLWNIFISMKRSRRHRNILIKSILVLAVGWFLLYRLQAQEDPERIWHAFIMHWQQGTGWLLVLIILMMPVNWMMEVIKWRMLLQPAIRLPWKKAIAGVLSGITFSLFTPNRIGEYGGRILHLEKQYAWHAVMASLTGSFAQNIVHLSFGLFAILVLFGASFHFPLITDSGIWYVSAAILLVIWLTYLSLPFIAGILSKWQPPRLLIPPWQALGQLSKMTLRQLGLALLLACSRYLVFSLQYVLLLHFFGVDIPWIWLFGGVALIYLVQTTIPFPPVIDLVARNEVGLLLWAGFSVNELSVVAAGFSVWIINLLLPALFGILAIAAVNAPETLDNEHETISTLSPQHPPPIMDRTSL